MAASTSLQRYMYRDVGKKIMREGKKTMKEDPEARESKDKIS